MLRQPRPLVPFTFPFAGQSYARRILNTQPANLIADWQLDETSGTNAVNAEGTSARDGTYVNGVTLNAATFTDGAPAPSFDGSNDCVNVYSSSLNSAFNNGEITLMAWVRVSASGDWTDGTNRRVFQLEASTSTFVRIAKAGNNLFEGRYAAGGVAKFVQFSLSSTNWFHIAMTISKSADQMKVYLNGTQQGSTQTGLGTWSGALDSALCAIGAAASSTPSSVWKGNIKYATVWTTPLSASGIATLATV